MGTNFYWTEPVDVCEHCGRGDGEEFHIGKSSAGWVFALRLHPESGINSLDEWKKRFALSGSIIRDEYGQDISASAMLDWIVNRKHPNGDFMTTVWLAQNHAVRGPNNLAMSDRGIPGDGPYEMLTHEFS